MQLASLGIFVHLLLPVLSWQQKTSRRRLFDRFLQVSSGILSASHVDVTNAIQGAAEYDLEYYMRDLFQGNPKQGTKPASKIPIAPKPRILVGPLQPLLLDDELIRCIPIKVLCNLLPEKGISLIQERLESIRSAASRSFQSRAPWDQALLSDQYYFDLTSYALWKVTAELLPDYNLRNTFIRNIGRSLYSNTTLFPTRPLQSHDAPLTNTLVSVKEILDLFTASKFCSGYAITGENEGDTLFDGLDDNDISNGGSVNCLISLYSPATLGACLQITGEQSRFIPDFVGSTLAAMWESIDIDVSYETYFVDQEYRPNPKDYFPDEQLLQFTMTMKR